MGKQKEKDPITGQDLNRLTNYNNSEPVQYRKDIDLRNITPVGYTPTSGVTGDANLVDYTPSKYDKSVLVTDLPNLENIRSGNQGIFDSLGRSTANLIGKTAVNVVGGLLGTAYGGVEAIREGKLSNLWDNDLTTELDKASSAIGDYFKVYKSSDYNDMNILAKAVLHPVMFTDETMDALSFTTGAVLTEMISGGLASGAVGARALKYFKTLGKGAEAAEVGANMSNVSSQLLRGLGNAGTLSRQLATGAAYEASVEARQASLELREKLTQDWLKDNPGLTAEDMPESIRNNIDEKLSNAGLFTFLTNLALVGSSNIIQFPKVFGAGYNTSKRASDLSSRITRDAEGNFIDNLANPTRGQRIARNTATALKNPFMEGIVEEGGQGVISGTATEFFSNLNDEDSKSTVDEFLNAFGKSLIETYTTKEGWNEIGMGMLIGSMGAPGRGVLSAFGQNTRLGQAGFNEDGSRRELWTGGIAGAFQERAQQTAEIQSYINDLNENTNLIKAMKANYDFLVMNDSIDKKMYLALDMDDAFTFNNLKDDKVHSYITSRLKAGLASDIDTTVDDLQRMNPDEFYTEFRGLEATEKATDEEKRKYKLESIESFKRKVDDTKKAYDIVDSVYQGDNELVRDYFAHSIASAKYLDAREKAINHSLSDLSNGMINNLDLRNSESISINEEIKRLSNLSKSEELSLDERASIDNTIAGLNNLSDKNRNITIDEYNALVKLAESDPVTFSLNSDIITEFLSDSKKIRARRQEFINTYNSMFTKEGIERVERQQRAFEEQIEKQKQEAEAAIAKQEEDKAVREREKEKETRKQEIKEKAAPVKKTEVAEETDIDNIFGTATFEAEGSNLTDNENTKIPSEANSQELTTQEKINELNNKWQAELDALREEFDSKLVNDLNTPYPQAELDEINSRYQSQMNDLNNQLSQESNTQLTPEETAIMTNINQEEAYETAIVLKQDGLVRNDINSESKEEGYKFIDATFKREVPNTLISLNINYAENVLGNTENKVDEYRIYDSLTEDGRLDINSNFDSRLQDPNQFNVGTTVNIIFPTYQQIADRGIEMQGYTESQYNDDLNNPERTPIAFTDGTGKILGFLPTTDNVRRRVAEQVLDSAVLANKELRNTILENRNSTLTATIVDKSTGTPMFQRAKQSIYDALGDGTKLADDTKVAIYKEGRLQIGLNNTFQGKIKLPDGVTEDMYFEEGVSYSVVPTAQKGIYFAFPMDVSTLGDKGANTIIKMLELYKASEQFNDNELLDERSRLSMETDFSNFKELSEALSNIIYVNNDNDNYMLKLDNKKLILGPTKELQFTWNEFRNNPAIKDAVRDILSSRFYAVKLANIGNPTTIFELDDNNQLQPVRDKNYLDYVNRNNVLQTKVQSEPVEGTANTRYFTAQSVIEIGNVKVEPKQLTTADSSPSKTTSTTEESVITTQAVEAPTKPKNKLGVKLKSNRNKPRIDEDFSELFNIFNKTNDYSKVDKNTMEVYNQFEELKSIGSAEEYSAYLQTIFPFSQVKDIVYHGGTKGIESFKAPNDPSFIRNKGVNSGTKDYGIYFTGNKDLAKYYSKGTKKENRHIYSVLLDMQNPFKTNIGAISIQKIFRKNIIDPRSLTDKEIKLLGDNDSIMWDGVKGELIVLNPSQIHILGSKKDISGFKDYVKNKSNKSTLDKQAELLMKKCSK